MNRNALVLVFEFEGLILVALHCYCWLATKTFFMNYFRITAGQVFVPLYFIHPYPEYCCTKQLYTIFQQMLPSPSFFSLVSALLFFTPKKAKPITTISFSSLLLYHGTFQFFMLIYQAGSWIVGRRTQKSKV